MLRSRGTGTRRSNACWTCKLRRKKCDESQPACLACMTRNITCHGYDIEQPQWMDSDLGEKAELDRIQHAVKENKRRQRKQLLQAQAEARRSSLPNTNGRPCAVTEPHQQIESLDALYESPRTSDLEQGASRQQMIPHIASPVESSAKVHTPITEIASISIMIPDITGTGTPFSFRAPTPSNFLFNHLREAELLMHYLDVVFALQFRFHIPLVGSGGRGWLLWLLTETKPLYHAALSLGALHQHSLLSRAERMYDETLIELNAHHNRAIQELQIFLQSEYNATNPRSGDRKGELQVLASGVQLVSFELFRGGINVWDPHLKALAMLLNNVPRMQALADNVAHDHHRLEDTAEKFLIGSVLWFDIMACASTGEAPRVKRETHDLLLDSDHIKLSNIVGCQAWVAMLISEIARLLDESMQKSFSKWQLVERGSPIRQELMQRISQLRSEIEGAFMMMNRSQIMLDSSMHSMAVNRAVTLAFACATQVYLNTAVIGANPHDPDIRSTVEDTANAIREMQSISDPQAIRSLVWPICIAGSMAAEPSLQSYFRSLIENLGEQAHDFGNTVTVLRILEKCWSHWQDRDAKGTHQGYTWLTAMQETGQWILLV